MVHVGAESTAHPASRSEDRARLFLALGRRVANPGPAWHRVRLTVGSDGSRVLQQQIERLRAPVF